MTLVNANTASSHFIAPNVTADTLLTFQLTITDNGGASSVSSVNITVQNINLPPIANSGGDQVVNSADAIYLDGSASYDPDGIILSYNWIQTAGPTVVLATADTKEAGFVAPMVDVATVINFQLTVVDDAGNSAAANVAVTVNSILATLPPDPATIAPPLDPNVPSNIYDMTSFLYTGANPIQTGVAAGTIEARRAVVLRGKVLDRQNIPLPGVNITVRRHSEFGQTISRVDGMFDLVINGGSYTTVNYKKDGFISIQREINTPWDQFALLPNVVMLPLDTQATVIDLTSTIPIQVAQGSIETDADGTRRAVILFPAGVNASLLMPDGTKQPISKLTVRATEYTVGSNGPEAMPGTYRLLVRTPMLQS